jgi:glycosyltransferase involved in cell wall biosynthesis
MLDISIATHNPRQPLFSRVLESIARQSDTSFGVLIVDNASTPALSDTVLTPLRTAGIAARLVREDVPGLIHARLCAIAATQGDWMLCVDDDNVLAPDYVAQALKFIAANHDVAAFGGKLMLPQSVYLPAGVAPFLPYLAIRDIGDEPKKGVSARWEIWEPPAAGAVISRAVLEDFAAFVRNDVRATALGRTPGGFASCEDSLLMHSAFKLGKATAYAPTLRLEHHIAPERFTFGNLTRLMEGYGRSHAVLEQLLRGPVRTPPYYKTPARVASLLLATGLRDMLRSPTFSYARARYHIAAARAYRELEKSAH